MTTDQRRDYEHRDVRTILGWEPVEWRCKECRATAERVYDIAHTVGCSVSAKENANA